MDIPRIMEELIKFRDDRDWGKYHTTKNLTTSLCIKAANLLEIFQWKKDEDISLFVENEKDLIKEKMADILIFIFYLCRNLGINAEEMETAMYCRLIKEGANFNLTEKTEITQASNSNHKFSNHSQRTY